jgi:hypothetical protein
MKSPVLVIGFNRPELLRQVLESLRAAAPSRVYLAIDGPREGRIGEAERVRECRELVSIVDWDVEVHTLFQERNLGCGQGVSAAISWFFECETEGIILEDDILVDPSFFPFCDELLERYRDNPRVFAISGCNFVPPDAQTYPEDAYRFSQIPHIWGWATWRRSWAQHQLDVSDWREQLPWRKLWMRSGRSLSGAIYWALTFEMLGRKRVDTWDGQFVLASMKANSWTATSNVNLVENLGFGADATHTHVEVDTRAVESVSLPTKPISVEPDGTADAWVRKHHFNVSMVGFTLMGWRYLKQQTRRRTS